VNVDGLRNRDWEDLAAGSDGTLYVADIGDNAEERPEVEILVLASTLINTTTTGSIPVAHTIVVRYPDGPHDAEVLLHDPLSGELFVITKSLDGDGIVFRIVPRIDFEPVLAEEVGRLDLGLLQLATAGDISADGSTIVVRTYTGVFVWDRPPGTTVAEALAADPCPAVGPPDAQGEAIAIRPDGSGYVTTSEGARAPVWLVRST
jgi:hypothetical protein